MQHQRTVRSLAALLAVTLIAAPASAAEDLPVEPGRRVRVTAAAPGLFHGVAVGTILKVGAGSLTLADPEHGTVTELPLASITRLEVSEGRRRHTWQGLLIGAAVGLAFAPLLSADKSMQCGDASTAHPCTQGERNAVAVFAVGMFAGGGAFWGHKKQSEGWRDSPVQRLKLTVRPEHGGGRVALAWAF